MHDTPQDVSLAFGALWVFYITRPIITIVSLCSFVSVGWFIIRMFSFLPIIAMLVYVVVSTILSLILLLGFRHAGLLLNNIFLEPFHLYSRF